MLCTVGTRTGEGKGNSLVFHSLRGASVNGFYWPGQVQRLAPVVHGGNIWVGVDNV